MRIIVLLFLVLSMNYISAQIAINNDGSVADSSAVLDISSNNKGLLIPRVNLSGYNDTETINNLSANISSAKGLLVYNKGENQEFNIKGFFYWSGSEWKKLEDEASDKYSKTEYKYVPDYKCVSYIGPYIEHDTINGIRIGNFSFKIARRPSIATSNNNLTDNLDIYIRYNGNDSQITLISKTETIKPTGTSSTSASFVGNYSYAEFGIGDNRSLNTLNKDVWYGWGGNGTGIRTNNATPPSYSNMITEKKQFVLTTSDKNNNEFYRCEFMVFGNYLTTDTKIIMNIELFTMQK